MTCDVADTPGSESPLARHTICRYVSGMDTTTSANIRAEMARAAWKQERLAELLDLPQPAISRRLGNVTPWRVIEVRAIAKALGVPLSLLLSDTTTTEVAS